MFSSRNFFLKDSNKEIRIFEFFGNELTNFKLYVTSAMLAAKKSAGVAPQVNLRIPLLAGDEAHKREDPLWLSNPRQTSSEVQNREISGQTKRTDVLQNFFKKLYITSLFFYIKFPSRQHHPGAMRARGTA